MAGSKKLRYACLTAEEQAAFDRWNNKQQNYAIYRAQGMDKANAYRMAGYQNGSTVRQNAYQLEKNTPLMAQIIEAMAGRRVKFDALKEHSEVSKIIDEKAANELKTEMKAILTQVPEDSVYVDKTPFNAHEVTVEQALDIQFYRQIANGTIKSVTVTKKFDKDGKLVSKTIVEDSSIETRMKAQKEVMRKVGIADVLEIGRVEANNINIMIVDASKKDELDDKRNELKGEIKEIDGELALVQEKEEKDAE